MNKVNNKISSAIEKVIYSEKVNIKHEYKKELEAFEINLKKFEKEHNLPASPPIEIN